ncbi:uncharacterized protein [Neodiprion pinetum]|uniref:uncharacterized protein n=1 Tax=Neodiprion pinetum TaxID=441929 RepID=UPI001EDE1C8F|nr:uncharacterized protein LOC124213009 [Neodiprion pinetum]XP_046469722.1 uncharacterized protein LOC124213009 [Neodiprion pinetum]XP_046469723.1 uncharacterized protein LOC124213009 [Neodiprion pinetum]XP_046469724.1 uncharacterized protein LOC124213009 [Neodiprion pinetum]XP_046469725.1 uncharacterized protein LOC124213009 [Neodiprion pinetum]
MATCTNTVAMGLDANQSSKENTENGNIGNIALPANDTAAENLSEPSRCFVCDVKVQGRYYALATCRTQSSRARVIEKLGELVGERYMVVISEDDLICRGCANLMNTLDRLENEMRGVKDVILRFLERKYSLEEGELLGSSETVKPCQPPQITKSHTQNGSGYHGRKRAAVSAVDVSSDGGKQKKSNNVWMQCDKCRYTTRYNAFMVHHIRQHIKQRITCDKCGVQIKNQQSFHLCKEQEFKNESVDVPEIQNNVKEPVVESFATSTIALPNCEKDEHISIVIPQSDHQLEDESKKETVQLIRLSSPDHLDLQNMVTSGDVNMTGHEVYVRVLQHVEDEHGNPQVAVESNSNAGMVVSVKEGSGKQMLTLAEDGSLEMVEVTSWDDVHSSQSDPDLPF